MLLSRLEKALFAGIIVHIVNKNDVPVIFAQEVSGNGFAGRFEITADAGCLRITGVVEQDNRNSFFKEAVDQPGRS